MMVKAEMVYEVRKAGMKSKATIARVETKKAGEIFGEAAKAAEQLVLVVHPNIDC